VQEALRKLIGALERMPANAPPEFCSLFPLFTAGCESRDAAQRTKLLNRFFVLEKSGLKQVSIPFSCIVFDFNNTNEQIPDSTRPPIDATLLG
jgi:hypothetical protein